MKKWIASSLVAALILLSPGFEFYARAAEVIGPEGAAPTPTTPVIPAIQVVPQNLDVLKGAQGLPINGAPIALPEALPGVATPAAHAASPAAQAASLRAQAQQAAAASAPAARAQLDAAGAKAAAVDQALGSRGGEASAKEASDAAFDQSKLHEGDAAAPVAGADGAARGSELSSFIPQRGGGSFQPPTPPSGPSSTGPRSFGSKLLGAIKSLAVIGAAGAAVVGLQMGGAALLPAVFGIVPEAAVWAVASGVIPPLLLAGVYTRYRLAKRDSPRLAKVKLVLDVSLGAFLGALAIAAPSFSISLAAQGLGRALPLIAAAGVGTVAAQATNGGGALNTLLGGAAIIGIPMALRAAAAGAIGLGPIAGMLALPAMTTIAFFLGSIINSAESGRPFSVPGSMQKMRFPSFNWVMIGVVFALVTGYSAVHANLAFMAWTLLGNKSKGNGIAESIAPQVFFKGTKLEFQTPGVRVPPVVGKILNFVLDFDHLFLGVVAISAVTGFHSPLTFLALAFAPERAAVWTERLLAKFLPASKPAPSSNGGLVDDTSFADKLEAKVPNFHNWLKTGLILAVMAGSVGLGAVTIFGVSSIWKSAIPALLMSALPFFASRVLVKAMMKAQPTTREKDPEFFDVMDNLRDTINAKRAKMGRKPIPMPEMVNVPMDVPNAFATGPSPFHATVGVTVGIKDMLLDPENVRDQLTALVLMFDRRPDDPKFKVFRRAIAGSVAGVSESASPRELAQAVSRAKPEELRALGKRMLRGVLSHEFSHVMDRHMLTGSIAGFFSTVFAFSSYGIMWGVGHAQVAAKRLKARLLGRAMPADEEESAQTVAAGNKTQGAKPEVVEPLSTAVTLKSLPALLKVLAALWGPVILQITQMAGSRNNEGQADFDGAMLSQDPESLALALGMLMTWRPRNQFIIFRGRRFGPKDLPLMASVAPMFTVNPLEQLSATGAPSLDPLANGVVGKGDNFLFNLFITHPDTGLRIERLWRVSEGLRAQQKPKDVGGGKRGPPLASVSPLDNTAPANGRGGSFRGGWGKLLSFFRVLPDKDRNAQFWKFVWGQALVNIGLEFHYNALGGLADPTGKDPQRVSYNRADNAASQLGSSLLTGPMVDRASVQKVMAWTYGGRALFLLAVPMIFFAGHGVLPFIAFQLIIFANGFLQSTGSTAASVAFNRILGEDTASYNRANAIYNIVTGMAGFVAPLAAGVFVAAVNARFGLLSGNALSYAIYGLLLLGVVGLYRTLKLPRDDLLQARRDLNAWLKEQHRQGKLMEVRSVASGFENGQPILHLEVKGELPAGETVPAEFSGYRVKVVPAVGVVSELLAGFRAILKSRFLRLYLLFSTVVSMMSDPLVFSVIGTYVKTGIKSVAAPAFLAKLPFLASIVADFTKTPAALFGFYLAASSLGGVLASFILIGMRDRDPDSLERNAGRFAAAMARKGLDSDQLELASAAVRDALPDVLAKYKKSGAKPSDTPAFGRDVLAQALANLNLDVYGGKRSAAELDALARETGLADGLTAWARTAGARRSLKSGLTTLERQGRWSSVLHGVGWLLFWGVFGTGSLWLSASAMVVSSVLQGPAISVWSSLVTEALRRNHRQEQGKVYSAINFYQLVFFMLGPILFGSLLTFATSHPAVSVLRIALWAVTLMAALDVWQGWKNFPIETRRRNP